MADIICTVPDCDAQAVLVLNGRPVCRPHCEELASQAVILDGSFRDVLKGPTDEPWPVIAGPFPSGLDVVDDAGTPSLPNGPDQARLEQASEASHPMEFDKVGVDATPERLRPSYHDHMPTSD